MTTLVGSGSPRWAAWTRSSDERNLSARFLLVLGPTAILLFLVTLPQLIDPLLRHDDYPALLAQPEVYWHKTLDEGRWINWVWMLRGVVTPAWLNHIAYQGLFAVFAAGLATVAIGERGKAWSAVLLAVLIVVAPMATTISLWFNTLLPGMAILAVYAVLACHLSSRTVRLLLPPFVIVSFLAYTNHPLLLLAICLCRTKPNTTRDLAGLLGVFVASFAAAILLTYSLNWSVHGVFGIPPAEWREATPASGLAGLSENLPLAGEALLRFISAASCNNSLFGTYYVLAWTFAMIGLLKTSRREAIYLGAGLALGAAMIMAQALKLGVGVPARAMFFMWVFLAIILVRSAIEAKPVRPVLSRAVNAVVAFCICTSAVNGFEFHWSLRDWQVETRAMAQALEAVEGPIVLQGDVMELASAQSARLQDPLALSFRLEYLSGRNIPVCEGDLAECERYDAEVDPRVLSLEDWMHHGTFALR